MIYKPLSKLNLTEIKNKNIFNREFDKLIKVTLNQIQISVHICHKLHVMKNGP
jgi:hypothetical protein